MKKTNRKTVHIEVVNIHKCKKYAYEVYDMIVSSFVLNNNFLNNYFIFNKDSFLITCSYVPSKLSALILRLVIDNLKAMKECHPKVKMRVIIGKDAQ